MTHQTGIKFGMRARALAAALALGGALLSLPAEQAEARPAQPKLCAHDLTNMTAFFLPGEISWAGDRYFVCTKSGSWQEWDGSARHLSEAAGEGRGGVGRGKPGRGGR